MHLTKLAKGISCKKPIVPFIAVAAVAFVLLAATAAAAAQSAGKQVEVWTQSSINQRFAGMAGAAKSTGLAGSILGSYEGHIVELSSRTASGQVEVHQHFVDIMVVTKGQATLLTGGTVLGTRKEADGEERGTSMRGG